MYTLHLIAGIDMNQLHAWNYTFSRPAHYIGRTTKGCVTYYIGPKTRPAHGLAGLPCSGSPGHNQTRCWPKASS